MRAPVLKNKSDSRDCEHYRLHYVAWKCHFGHIIMVVVCDFDSVFLILICYANRTFSCRIRLVCLLQLSFIGSVKIFIVLFVLFVFLIVIFSLYPDSLILVSFYSVPDSTRAEWHICTDHQSASLDDPRMWYRQSFSSRGAGILFFHGNLPYTPPN